MSTVPIFPESNNPTQKITNTKIVIVILSILLCLSVSFGSYQYTKKWEQIRSKDAFIQKFNSLVALNDLYSPNKFSSTYASSINANFQSLYQSSFNNNSNNDKQPLPNLYGWIGGNQIKMELYKYGHNDIVGKYFSALENKTFEVNGTVSEAIQYQGNLASMDLVDRDNGKVVGKFRFNTEQPQGSPNPVFGLDIENRSNTGGGLRFRDLRGLSGEYTDLENNNYDVYLTTNEDEVKNWKVVTIEGELIKSNNQYNQNGGNSRFVFIKQKDGKYIAARDMLKFDKFSTGSKVSVTGKIRKYNQGSNLTVGQCGQAVDSCKNYSAKEGIFNITEVK